MNKLSPRESPSHEGLAERASAIRAKLDRGEFVEIADIDDVVRPTVDWLWSVQGELDSSGIAAWGLRGCYFPILLDMCCHDLSLYRVIAFDGVNPISALFQVLAKDDHAAPDCINPLVTAIGHVANAIVFGEDVTLFRKILPAFIAMLARDSDTLALSAFEGLEELMTIPSHAQELGLYPGAIPLIAARLTCFDPRLVHLAAIILSRAATATRVSDDLTSPELIGKVLSLLNDETEFDVIVAATRFLFRISVHPVVRPTLIEFGILDYIAMIDGGDELVSSYMVGCLANLCLTEREAKSFASPAHLLPWLDECSSCALAGQLVRVLCTVVREDCASGIFDDNAALLARAFVKATDERMYKGLGAILSILATRNNENMAIFDELNLIQKCVRTVFPGTRGATSVPHLAYILMGHPNSRKWAIDNAREVVAYCVPMMESSARDTLGVYGSGILASVCHDAGFASTLGAHPRILEALLVCALESNVFELRWHCSRIILAATNRQDATMEHLAQCGGFNGDSVAYVVGLRELFEGTFEWDASPTAPLPRGVRAIEIEVNQVASPVLVHLFSPYILVEHPTFFTPGALAAGGGASKRVWVALFDYISTRDSLIHVRVPSTVLLLASELATKVGLKDVGNELNCLATRTDPSARVITGTGEPHAFTRLSASPASSAQLFAPEHCDVALIARTDGGTHLLWTNSKILAARSPFFAACFSKRWKGNRTSTIDLEMPLRVAEFLIKYIYFGLTPDDTQMLLSDKAMAFSLLKRSTFFGLMGLRLFCEFSLVQSFAGALDLDHYLVLADKLLTAVAPVAQLFVALRIMRRCGGSMARALPPAQMQAVAALFSQTGLECPSCLVIA